MSICSFSHLFICSFTESIHKYIPSISNRPGGSPRLSRWLQREELTCQCRRHGCDPWVGMIPWERNWQPTPVFLPGKSYGQRGLVGYSPWGLKGAGDD